MSHQQPNKSINIWIRLLTGNTISFQISPSERIGILKQNIQDKTGMSILEHRLSFHNKPLNKDHLTISDYGITNESWLQLNTRIGNINSIYPDLPQDLTRLDVSELLNTCSASKTDTVTQIHCAKLFSIMNINSGMAKTLIVSLLNQSHTNNEKLEVIATLMDTKDGKFTCNCPLWRGFHDIIIPQLNPFIDATMHYTVLLNVSKILRVLCVEAVIMKDDAASTVNSDLLDQLTYQLNFLLMYCGSMEIMENALDSYYSLMSSKDFTAGTQRRIGKITEKMTSYSNDNRQNYMKEHSAKFQTDVKVFDNYMNEVQTTFDTIIHKDVIIIISKYFHCFLPQPESCYSIVARLINLIDMKSNITPQWKALRTIYLMMALPHFPKSMEHDMISKYGIVTKLRQFLCQKQGKHMPHHIVSNICCIFYFCLRTDKYCLLHYEALDSIMYVFMKYYKSGEISEAIISILNKIKEIIPKEKLNKLLKKYKFITQICRCINHINTRIKESSLDLIEYFLQMKEKNIGKICVEIIVSHDGIWYLKSSSLQRAKQLCQRISVFCVVD